MTVYLVADYRLGPYPTYKPYWRVMGMFNSLIHAKAFASCEGIVTAWSDHDIASKAYQTRRLPDVYQTVS